ncbi:MAG TPA: hypothetical protein VIL36_09860, partial [Acidimicrobiales bacterium]
MAAVAGSVAVAAAVARRRSPSRASAPTPAEPPPPLPRRRPDTGEIAAVPATATLDVAPGAIADAPPIGDQAHGSALPEPVTDGDPDARFETAAHLLADLTGLTGLTDGSPGSPTPAAPPAPPAPTPTPVSTPPPATSAVDRANA